MERLENCGPVTRLFKLVKSVFEVGEKPTNSLVQCPKENGRGHVRYTEQPKNYRVHWTELDCRRSGQQHTKDDQVMIEAGNTLLGNHVEVPPCAVVLFKNSHLIFRHNANMEAPNA